MDINKITTSTPLILRFYARCLLFPYEEMNYELHHLFRTLESSANEEDEYDYVEQILNVINQYQGEEINSLRSDYAMLFSYRQDSKPLCPMVAGDFLAGFAKHYDSDELIERLLNSELMLDHEEPLDSVINYLEYFSLICDNLLLGEENSIEIENFYEEHILNWIPNFCDVLYKACNVSFYRELAVGLKEYLFFLI